MVTNIVPGSFITNFNEFTNHLQRILQVIQAKIINSLLIFDSSLKLLGHSEGKGRLVSDDWLKTVEAGYIRVADNANEHLVQAVHSIREGNGKEYRFTDFNQSFYLQKIGLRNSDHFYLVIVIVDRPNFEKDKSTIESVIDKISATVGLHNFPYQSQGNNLEGLLRDILVRPNISVSEIKNRLQFDPHQLKRPLSVLCIKAPTTNIQPLGTILTRFISFYYDDYNVYMVENSSPLITKTIMQELTPYLIRNKTSAGLSNSFTRLHQFNQFYQQAVKAIRLGEANTFNQYHDYIALDLLDHIRQDQSLNSYLSPQIQKLAKENSELFKTLKLFLLNHENKKQTALDLQIHRSTLDYRLNKLEQEYEINYDAPREYLYIFLSCLLVG
ncbi:helix-turn-helix domain-containing protein [Limosilactobacillus reuteri]|uniref:helix-turn-helix domain-containing protein n=1 Tax=Limosilactobacillus reuteri TaxID=1598 RepID=UPI001E53B067|nr:helix-turn-helix domain-containing protein [Limosilactobacillus reuteri]MCC4361913.1 helix-turn-helix domain-containing protein [Limosilactobacillus reuteri]